MMRVLRPVIIIAGLIFIWQIIVWLSGAPHFILPAPARVAEAWWAHHATILGHAGVTLLEIALGLLFGALLGASSALTLAYFRPARLSEATLPDGETPRDPADAAVLHHHAELLRRLSTADAQP